MEHPSYRKKEFLYLQLAEGIERSIENGTLKSGDRLPSVRIMSQEKGVSQSTVYQAYFHLESKGYIEARPRSGYYVRFNPHKWSHLPAPNGWPLEARAVKVEDMILRVYKALQSDDILRFSVAAPSPTLLPVARLQKSIHEAMRQSKSKTFLYEDIQGNEHLRRQLARQALSWGGAYGPDDFVVTAGCMEALFLCLRAVTEPGDAVAIESPTFFGIFQVIERLHLKVVEIPTHPATGIILEELETAIRQFHIKACLFVPNFNNPLGSCMPDEKKTQLVALLARHNIPLIEDDIYGDMYFGKHRPLTCKSFDREGMVLYCSSFSKSLSPGFRIGWTLPGRYRDQVMREKLVFTVTTATLPQIGAAHFLENGRYEHHLRRLRKALHTQCLRYLQAIADYFPEEVRVSRPQGGFVLWIALPGSLQAGELYEAAIQQRISIAPGGLYSLNGKYNNYLRLSFGQPYDDRIDHGLQVLGKLIRRMQ